MKVIIAGGRDIDLHLHDTSIIVNNSRFEATEVVSGGAAGIDSAGEVYANSLKIKLTVFKADWKRHGKAAGPIRNKKMAEHADALILIWDGKSRGSANMLKQAKEQGLQIYEWFIPAKADD